MSTNKLLIIGGPTGVGKSDIALNLAKELNGEIISADSVAVYRGLDIGSAKPDLNMRSQVKHHLIDILDPDEYFGIDEFVRYGKAALDDIYSRGKLPIITGGTGFYIQALIYGIDFDDEEDHSDGYRDKLNDISTTPEGVIKLYDQLTSVDPEYANTVHPNNVKRVIRALEYNHHTGRLFSELNKEQRSRTSPYDFVYTAIDMNRDRLYERINKRVDLMMDAGLIDEVRGLLAAGYGRDLNSMSSIGYKEICSYLADECELDKAVYDIKLNSRHYAKRQLTWLRREKDVHMIMRDLSTDAEERIMDEVRELIYNHG
ncbi:MAG: tRNA (adenosine(37)-N6)-dimethylallyltransferase MiaA [Lachnospiraceae bacterium]|nr:tRNA (adenosine(37)-N6)-dimethylallyltransferase MiaA [Lachnospiraceae bacterium]